MFHLPCPLRAPTIHHAPPRWIVLKFGGTSVSERKRWDTIGALMRARAERENVRVLTVVSALSGITNALQAVIDAHADDAACAKLRVAAIVQRHRVFRTHALALDADVVLGERLRKLDALLGDPRRRHAGLDWQAEVLAQGELLSSTLGAAYLSKQGATVGWIDARDWLHAAPRPNQSDWARRLSVSCATSRPDRRVARAFRRRPARC